MQIGKYKLHVVETGYFGLDGGAMFGVIPKPLWEKTNPADVANRVTLGARCLLLDSGSRKILIDTGIGDDWDEKFLKIYRVEQEKNILKKSLAVHGVTPDQITDVILTHLHFDHTGGSTELVNGKFVTAFPNAKYHVQKQHYEWAMNPTERDKASFIRDRFVPLHDAGVLNLIDKETHVEDEIELIKINGHTFAQQMVKISDGSNTILYCGDLFPFASHIPLPYVMGYDLQPVITVQEKKTILPRAVDEEWKLVFEHDPFSAAATVQLTDKGYSAKEKFTWI
ncbi:MAG: MBL fold metallo-hydrolase [bacterium]